MKHILSLLIMLKRIVFYLEFVYCLKQIWDVHKYIVWSFKVVIVVTGNVIE